MKKFLVGLAAGLTMQGMVGTTHAKIIYTESPSNATWSNWSNTETTNVSGYGYVHGLWGNDNQTLSRVFSLSGTQNEVIINFRYWAISS